MNKIIKSAYLNRPRILEVEIYTYKFSDGKIYIGYTSHGLESRHNQHKTRSISPIYQYLNTEEIFPNHEETVTVDLDSGNLYKIQRKILDRYTTNVNQILNTNLKLLGY